MAKLTKRTAAEATFRLFNSLPEAALLRAAARNYGEDYRPGRDDASAERELLDAALSFARAIDSLNAGPLGHSIRKASK